MCQVLHIDTCYVCNRVEAYMECWHINISVGSLQLPFGCEDFSVVEHIFLNAIIKSSSPLSHSCVLLYCLVECSGTMI